MPMPRNTKRDTSARTNPTADVWNNPSRDGQRWPDRITNRITCIYEPEEKRAIDWLSRCPVVDRLPKEWQPLAGKAARAIAKQLDLARLQQLVKLREKLTAS